MGIETGRNFWDKTQYKFLGESEQERGLPMPPLELPIDPGLPRIALPAANDFHPQVDLTDLINNRRTLRTYAETPLSLLELSYLLWCTQGVRKITKRPSTSRSVPSAGARHALETLLLVNRVDGLQPGLYRFAAIENALVLLSADAALPAKLRDACYNQDHVPGSAVTFFWFAAFERMYYRYQERGYRYILLDAGHVCQNLYTAAGAIDCGVCAIGAFFDDELNPLLGLDGVEHFTVYAATLGKRIV